MSQSKIRDLEDKNIFTIECENIVLREFRVEDLEELYALTLQPEITDFLPDWKATKEQRKYWLINFHMKENDEFLKSVPSVGEHLLTLGIILKETNEFIGWCLTGIKDELPKPNREIAYAISKDYREKGYTTEAAKGIIKYLFEETDVEVINAIALTCNTPSNKVIQKCNFNFIGNIEIENEEFYQYKLTKNEWISKGRGVDMSNFKMISNYMENEKYRRSFNELAKNTFCLDFEDWYQNKVFFNKYINYSEIDGDKIVANVSINKMELIIDGKKKKALQLGTVMTQPEYRRKGLSRNLISHIIEEYKDEYDLIYLLANDSVLNFYPKFGFKKLDETSYKLAAKDVEKSEGTIRKLNTEDEEDKKIIKRLVNSRQPISKTFGVCNDIWPLLVYCFYEFKNDLYYLEDEDTIVILQRENGILNIYDVLSLEAINLDNIIERVVMPEDRTIELNFVPELCKYKSNKGIKKREDTTLFVIDKDNLLKEEIQFPMTSHT